MNRNYRRVSAAALALVLCLAATPIVTAKPAPNRDRFAPADPIVKVISKIKNFLGRIVTFDEPGPPHP